MFAVGFHAATAGFGASMLAVFVMVASIFGALFSASDTARVRRLGSAGLTAAAIATAYYVVIVWDCGWLPDWLCWL